MATKTDQTVFGFHDDMRPVEALAAKLGVPADHIDVHVFPDQETRVTVPKTPAHAILYRSLHHPNTKIFEVIQAASALRDSGAKKITFVCPYLPYMRQDKVFNKGEAFSQKILAQVLSPWIDEIITVEPHLHRTHSMATVFPDISGTALSGGKAMAAWYATKRIDKNTLVLGPDEEAWHTAQPFAEALNLEWTTTKKKRKGDKKVEVVFENIGVKGRPVLIVDDVMSSGMTVFETTRKAYQLGATSVEVAVVHALFKEQTDAILRQAGVSWVVSCDSVPHPSNKISLAPTIAKALKG